MALMKDEEIMNPLVSLLSEEPQPTQMMAPPQPAMKMPSLAEYLQGFLKTRLG